MGTRAGAFTLALDTWHLDLPEFIDMRVNTGDDRRKCRDIFTQVVCSDEFMRRVKSNEKWTLVDPYEVRVKYGVELSDLSGESFEQYYRQIEADIETGVGVKLYQTWNAKDLWRKIQQAFLETGLPYVFYKDTANRANPNPEYGTMLCGNLCMESWSIVVPDKLSHVCNLASLNLSNINDVIELDAYATLAVRILDNGIELSQEPIVEAEEHNSLFRTIGLGVMGLADYLAKQRKSYSDLDFISFTFELISLSAVKSSVNLAKERGSFRAYVGSTWFDGKLINAHPLEWFKTNSNNLYAEWEHTHKNIAQYGIRNSQLMMIAPNTSTSLLQDASSSVLPVYSRYFFEKLSKIVVPISVKNEDNWWFYEENSKLDQSVVIKAMATIQKWVDTGISMELIFNLNDDVYSTGRISAKDIFEKYIQAWELGCKTVYYCRTIQRDDVKEADSCLSCAN